MARKRVPTVLVHILDALLPAAAAFMAALLAVGAQPPAEAAVEPKAAVPALVQPAVPPKEVQQQEAAPWWKTLWDEAREAARAGEYQTAVQKFQDLLARKQNLEEARWELARIYLRLERKEEAIGLLELLLEGAPDQQEYLLSLAALMQERAHCSRAAGLYSRVLKQQPENRAALTGLAQCLVRLGKKEEALPYLEALYRQSPGNREIRQDLVGLAIGTGDLEKARTHLVELAEDPQADTDTLRLAAQVHEELDLTNLAIQYRQRILARKPDDEESHRRLGAFFEKQGRVKEALAHLQALLRRHPDDAALLQAAGRLLENAGRFDEALPYFERYIAQRPGDREALDSVVNIHTALGEEAKTLLSLERLFRVDPNPEPAKLLKAARLYDAAGRYRKAVPFYRRLLAQDPRNTELLAALAEDLQRLGEQRGALSLWRQLAALKPDDIRSYRAMATLLEKFRQWRELFGVLDRLQALDPTDQQVLLKLAALHLRQGELAKVRFFLDRLSPKTRMTPPALEVQALLLERLYLPSQALAAFEDLLAQAPQRHDIRLRCIRLAGELGEASVVRRHAGQWLQQKGRRAPADLLALAAAYAQCGAFDDALDLYRSLAAPARMPPRTRLEALLGEAALYRDAGLAYEAEQALRQALLLEVDEHEVLRELFDVALAQGALEDAAVWLQRWTAISREEGDRPALELMKARLLAAEGRFRAAISQARRLLELPGSGEEATKEQVGRPERQAALVRFELAAGRLADAREHCLEVLQDQAPYARLELLVLLQQAYELAGQPAEAEATAAQARHLAEEDAARLLWLASLYRQEGRPAETAQVAAVACRRLPESLKARFFLAEALEHSGKLEKALEIIARVATDYPNNSKTAAWEPKLLFQVGLFQQALEKGAAALELSPWRDDLRLLRARIRWARQEWPASLEVYKEYLRPPVEETFAELSKKEQVVYQPYPGDRTLWQKLTFRGGKEPGFLDPVMAPSHAVEVGSKRKRDLNAIAAPLFARYRWQKQFAAELAAKRSVHRREYLHALRQYEAILREHGEESSLLFDLAGVHSRLGNLGEEAVLYTRLEERNTAFPGLEEAVRRNRLKRQPRLGLTYGHDQEEGRDGYKAILEDRGEMSFWYSPRLQRELTAFTSRMKYRSPDSEEHLWANRGLFSYRANFRNGWWVRLGGGLEDFNHGYPATGLIDCAMGARLGDMLTTRFSYNRDLTKDTLASLTRNIVREDYIADLRMDLLSRMLLGGGYTYTEFSDDNATEGYQLWASWIILTEPTLLTFRYTYDFKDSLEGPRPGPPLADGFARDDHPYWAPRHYWSNEFRLAFKHLLSDETFGRGIPRYYTAEYSVGYDAQGYALQSLAGGLFVEWTPHFIMEATAGVTSSDPYRSKEVSVSAVYRW